MDYSDFPLFEEYSSLFSLCIYWEIITWFPNRVLTQITLFMLTFFYNFIFYWYIQGLQDIWDCKDNRWCHNLVINNTKKLVIILYIKQVLESEGYWHMAGLLIKALEEFLFLFGCSFLIFFWFSSSISF